MESVEGERDKERGERIFIVLVLFSKKPRFVSSYFADNDVGLLILSSFRSAEQLVARENENWKHRRELQREREGGIHFAADSFFDVDVDFTGNDSLSLSPSIKLPSPVLCFFPHQCRIGDQDDRAMRGSSPVTQGIEAQRRGINIST